MPAFGYHRAAMSHQELASGPSFAERARGMLWLVPLMVAAMELAGHAATRMRVPARGDWEQAAAYVGAQLRERDQVLAAPAWADPLLREQLGERLGIRRVGELDLEPFDRVWVVSLGGHVPDALQGRVPVYQRRFGELTVAPYRLGPSPVLHDFVTHWAEAEVSFTRDGVESRCARQIAAPRGGGLGQGAYWPRDRVVCDPQRPWMWFGPTVNEDRDLALRRCLFQHPSGPEPVSATYRDVPLGERFVVDADIYYENERNEIHGSVPFELRVLVDGVDAGTMRHLDGQGRKRMVVQTQPPGSDPWRRGTIRVEVTSHEPSLRTVCWSGSTRGPQRPEGPSR